MKTDIELDGCLCRRETGVLLSQGLRESLYIISENSCQVAMETAILLATGTSLSSLHVYLA